MITPCMTKEEAAQFIQALKAKNPNPKTELNYTNPYTLLVAVLLSAQSTDVGVNKATKKLFQIVRTPEDMLRLGESQLKKHIKTIGLFNSKAQNIINGAKILIEKYQGYVPENREALEALPGVGRKTANVVLNVAFGWPTVAVDTHIFRIANRTGLAPGKDPLAVEQSLVKKLPKELLQDAHHWLILHGRYCCKARKPLCFECPVFALCKYPDKTSNL
jgi:endonuclease-3